MGYSPRVQDFLRMLAELAGRPERVSELLQEVSLTSADLHSFIFFREQFYTRNLLYQDSHWEVLTLCWQKGQQTPIHDHNGSQGWAYLIAGSLAETIYEVTNLPAPQDFCLRQTARALFHPREISYINDTMGVHCLANTAEEAAISLHIYSPLISSCRYYSLAPRETKIKTLCYYSAEGTVLEG